MNAIALQQQKHENLQDLLNATADGSAGQYHLEDSTELYMSSEKAET
jgi:hypothetical protein